ncbi:MAG: AraC family ligand binding domain-containing protein [Phocaeicola vulgatus]
MDLKRRTQRYRTSCFLIEELKQDPLGSELTSQIWILSSLLFSGYRKRDTEVTEFILIYCMEGEGWFELDKHQYAVTASNFILPEHQAHAYMAVMRKSWTIYWIHFNGTKAAFSVPV